VADVDLPVADELSAVYARMSGLLLCEETVQSALGLVTALARETISSSVGAGVTLLDPDGHRTSAAATDAVVERADALQYELDEGPCLSAWAGRCLVRVEDLPDERWPRWSAAVAPLGLRAALSAPLVAADAAVGAVKVYGTQPRTFGGREERLLTMFAGQAAILVANVQSFETAKRISEELQAALRARTLIAQAMGVLMARRGVDEEAAFRMLAGVSQREHKTLREVATSVVQSTTRRGR
jgi:GAF domain-containing protein